VDSSVSALNKALNTLDRALANVRAAGVLQLNSLGLALTAKTTQFAISMSYDVVVADSRLAGSLAVQTANSPKDVVANFLRDRLIGVATTNFPAIAPYLR
jgi:hypothetical protein